MNKAVGPWRQRSIETVYENPWIKVEHHEVTTPAGSDGIYGKVCFKSRAVGVVPLDANGNTYLVKQFRYPLEEVSWEIPEGGCPLGESTLLTARRELEEETGFRASRVYKLLELHLSNSVCDEGADVFLALDLMPGEACLEDSEADLEVLQLPLHDAIAMALDGRITDAISVAALLKIRVLLNEENGDIDALVARMTALEHLA
ncbi:NUDIX hydrolase [Spongiibacter taiwanensis]|uniref:NUDIX domain-containing protein n=1 Tax=Spongiibacter taiwanensis TaxID=1748242 RepID=UPI002035FE69|nr:NUDIX hydrolase [Spongiibacter taiwanensis]USA43059.1 NUDIX hydrolase [Spongiibacter taiwanensis]